MNRLLLIPTPIYENGQGDLPQNILESIVDIRYFVVENLKSARRALRAMGYKANFDLEVSFFELDKHADSQKLEEVKGWMKSGFDIGVLSEAGLPCIADPGAIIVKMGHLASYNILPLAGPSSIIQALISSGLNGQNFAFNGYLPIDKTARGQRIKQLESRALSENQTQIFMETPYRNHPMFEEILKTCADSTIFAFAANIGSSDAIIFSKSIREWKKSAKPDIHKMPCIFILGKDL